jgi:signal transduction histidine kinase
MVILLFGVVMGVTAADSSSAVLTNLSQLRISVSRDWRKVCSFQLQAIVRAAHPESGTLFLQDNSEADVIELGGGTESFRPGQRILFQGTNCAVARTEEGLKVGLVPVVDVDGSHPAIESTGTVYLKDGLVPITLAWYNDIQGATLAVDYEGPGMGRQRIPESVLFRKKDGIAGEETNIVSGINYRCFEGAWERLPDFKKLRPVKSGATAMFDMGVRTRREGAGIEFEGLLAVGKSGIYKFYVRSDDGAKLFVAESSPQLSVIGSGPLPSPRRIAVGAAIGSERDESQWSEVEGDITFVARRGETAILELSSGESRMRVKVVNACAEAPVHLIGSRIRATGIAQGTHAIDKQRQTGAFIVPGWEMIDVLDSSSQFRSACPASKIRDLLSGNVFGLKVARVSGKLRSGSGGGLVLEDETGELAVWALGGAPKVESTRVEALGRLDGVGPTAVLRQAVFRNEAEAAEQDGRKKPVLTTAAQVQRLTREEAQRAYPVKISGVITFVAPNYSALVIQDSTRAIFVRHHAGGWKSDLPQLGDYWEIEGVSNPADFAPVVELKSGKRLGRGKLPDPIRPTWDQLINGSLDAQYVELQGVVTAVRDQRVTLLTRGEKINVTLPGYSAGSLGAFENAVIRIRGTLFASWDKDSHRLQINRGINTGNPMVVVDRPAPADPFDAAKKSAAELLFFDPQASALQRVLVAGQVVHERDGTFYLMDGTNGTRFMPKSKTWLEPGDVVEVAGYPQLGGPSPVLREAVARKTGRVALPSPRKLLPEELLQEEYDSMLVQIEGLLIGVRQIRGEEVLEMQSGLRTFVARLHAGARLKRSFEPGSHLELTGVYAGQGGNRADGREMSSFELLLNSGEGIRVLGAPPWWTPHRLLILAGALLGVLGLAAVWITQLHRQVEERTAQLAREIEERQRSEQRQVMAQERSRVAHDLHDELGAGLTEVSMLGALARNSAIPSEKRDGYLEQLTHAARSLVTGLDEIVWAVNPQYDSTASLATYYSLFAQRFLNLAGIACRLQVAQTVAEYPLDSATRHGIFLAFKEALNNIIRHSGASEVRLWIAVNEGELRVTVADNGRGFTLGNGSPGKHGLAGLHQRMDKLGGACRITSEPGNGTTVELLLPLRETVS